MIFLGTAAAECCPDPFCSCAFCENARTTRDARELRRRSALLLDEENLIDFGPDVMSACGAYGVSLAKLKNIFVTHLHEDHFSYWNIAFLLCSLTPPPKPRIFMSEQAAEGLNDILQLLRSSRHAQMAGQIKESEQAISLRTVRPFERIILESGLAVMAVQGNHESFLQGERSLNYLFQKDGHTLFYASDTGRFLPSAYDALREYRLDKLVIEGSFGAKALPEGAGHLDYFSLCDTLEALMAQGTMTRHTRVFVTHIAHHARMSHDEYERKLQERFGEGIQLAYDGLRTCAW